MKLSNDKKIIWKWSPDRSCICNYGYIVIPSMSDTVCPWDLTIRELKHNVSLFVGISSEVISNLTKYGNYYLIHDQGFRNNIGCNTFGANDKVSIKLDLINAELDSIFY